MPSPGSVALFHTSRRTTVGIYFRFLALMHVLRFLVCSQFRMALFYLAGPGGQNCLALWHLESAGVGAAGNAGYRQQDEVSPLWAIFCSLGLGRGHPQ